MQAALESLRQCKHGLAIKFLLKLRIQAPHLTVFISSSSRYLRPGTSVEHAPVSAMQPRQIPISFDFRLKMICLAIIFNIH